VRSWLNSSAQTLNRAIGSRRPEVSESFDGLFRGAVSEEVRVIFYFHNESMPVFLLAVYGKNEKANLTREERNTVAKMVSTLISGYSKDLGRKS